MKRSQSNFLKIIVPFLVLHTVTFKCYKQKAKHFDQINLSENTFKPKKLLFLSLKKFSFHEKRLVPLLVHTQNNFYVYQTRNKKYSDRMHTLQGTVKFGKPFFSLFQKLSFHEKRFVQPLVLHRVTPNV